MPLSKLVAAYITSYCDPGVSFASLEGSDDSERARVIASTDREDRNREDFDSIPRIISFTMAEVNPQQDQPQAGRRVGTSNCSREESLHFLGIMEEVLPIGPDEWQLVLDQHSAVFPGRTVNSMRRKHATLHRKQMPTGDPLMPPEVRAAKRVKYLIGSRADIGDGEDEYNLEEGNFNNNNNNNVAAPEEVQAPAPPANNNVPPVNNDPQPEESVAVHSLFLQ